MNFTTCAVSFFTHPEDGLILSVTSGDETLYVTVETPINVLLMGPAAARDRCDDGTPEQALETLQRIAAQG